MTTIDSPNEKELRKAWLKRKFKSFDYHEELVNIHEQWRDVLRKALARAEKDESPNLVNPSYGSVANEAKNIRETYMVMIDHKPKPGDYKRELWDQYYASGMFRSIPDYSRYLQSEGDALSWMTAEEDRKIGPLWGTMAQMAENIQYTVDDRWTYDGTDDWILDEEFTGPITWPANWRNEVSPSVLTRPPKVQGGQVCVHEGWWFTPASSDGRRYFKQGEVMPDCKSDYGMTIWQWDDRQ